MKKNHLWLLAAVGFVAAVFTSCSVEDNAAEQSSTYELRVLTFEDEDWKGGTNYVGGTDWTSLIDEAQYGGSLLYPEDDDATAYNWNDKGNTNLASDIVASLFDATEFWYGGEAVSNYVETDLTKGTFMTQLAVPTNGGFVGSKNFGVHFGTKSSMGVAPNLYFSDGVARVIDHMYVTNTTYTLNSIVNGDGFSKSLVETKGSLWIVATGYDENGDVTGTAQFDLCRDGQYVSTWKRFDLSSLGKVQLVEFDVDGTDKGKWGLNTPAYFAFDNVAVRF